MHHKLTLNLLTTTIVAPPSNASKWQMGFNSAFKGLIYIKRTNVMQLGSMFISNCNIALHVSDAFCVHLQEHLETVVAASGV